MMDESETPEAAASVPPQKAPKKRTMVVRLPVSLHTSLKQHCEARGVSINQHCVDALTASVQAPPA